MKDLSGHAFAGLFKEAVEKCFRQPLKSPLSEVESKHFANEILEHTGLVVGWKSLKNYSLYVLQRSSGKQQNPSVATLDTLARYVLDAPTTDENRRQIHENHYPYWFTYRDKFEQASAPPAPKWDPPRTLISVVGFGLLTVILLFLLHPWRYAGPRMFTDDFHSLEDDSLTSRGWTLQSPDSGYWARRGEKPQRLSLFTLRGDNWPDSLESPCIRNLLLRGVPFECFTVEVHLSDFVPTQNWQQAGILLLEDTLFLRKSIRLSLAYNDYSGGFRPSRQILVQAITSLGRGFLKPEEIAHKPLFTIEPGTEGPIAENLRNSAFRIEKRAKVYRFLYSVGSMENAAFTEVAVQEFDMEAKYVGLFAIRGYVNDATSSPVYIKFFSLTAVPCD